MKIFSIKVICFSLIILAFSVLNTYGQTTGSVGDFVNISISPKNPSPNEQIKVSVQGLSLDLNRAKITWLVNDIEKKTETGLKDYYLKTGIAGQTTKVSVKLEMSDGTIINKSLSFIPAGIDILYEAISYAPPFYKGKVLNPRQGTVVVAAFPEIFDQAGRKLSTKDLVFSWKKNDIVLMNASGLGKNYISFSGTIPVRDTKIEVSASSIDQKMTATNSIIISNTLPKIIFYEDSPVYGIMFNKAISSNVRMLADEFKVKAFPYFMSVGYTQSPDLNYKWSINGKSSENLDTDKTAMIFRQESEGSGTANIDLKIESLSRIFQFNNNGFTINFEK
jgi:hypothetical protein